MEKYYVIGTTILSLALTVPAVALEQFGYVQLVDGTQYLLTPTIFFLQMERRDLHMLVWKS